jgi:hypothetical protein
MATTDGKPATDTQRAYVGATTRRVTADNGIDYALIRLG